MRKYKIDKITKQIVGIGSFAGKDNDTFIYRPVVEEIENLLDEDGDRIYEYDEETKNIKTRKIIKTQEQIELKRKQVTIKEIHNEYSIDDEIAIIKKVIDAIIMQKQIPEEYIQMQNNVMKIKKRISALPQ
jgi:hypothetical protein